MKTSSLRSRCAPVVVVGSGAYFLSGISYYTQKLVLCLGATVDVGVILIRRSIPERFYPGRRRAGAPITSLDYGAGVEVVDGVDWSGGRALVPACRMVVRRRPATLVLQWWTGSVLHIYALLYLLARSVGSTVIVELHEVQDTGEANLPGVARYVEWCGGVLMRAADACIIHSESDRAAVMERFGVDRSRIHVINHGPFDQYSSAVEIREPPSGVINLLFFGTIRPYKGLEDLVAASDTLDDEDASRFWLTIVGETWEGWTLPLELVERSRHRERVTVVNRYVTDEEAGGYVAGADIMVLPYRRSSASGPLHVAMTSGLPVVVTCVGGLPEAARDYQGAVFVPPADPGELLRGIREASDLVGARFHDPHSWDAIRQQYTEILARAREL